MAASKTLAQACDAAPISPGSADGEAVFEEGRGFAARGQYPQARAMYAWLLARDPTHHDALLAVARLDAWQRCGNRAELRYLSLLRVDARDLEARIGLIDVLLWQRRWDEAGTAIEAGLRLDSEAAELWKRRARLYLWSHDRTRALESVARAERLAPHDPEVLEFRERLFSAQVRASVRVDGFPRGYPDLYTTDLQALQLIHRFEFSAQSQWITRHGGTAAAPIVDARHFVGVLHHLPFGLGLGAGLGFGAPASAVPRFAPKLWLLAPILPRLSGDFAYSLWQYRNDKTLHIFNPALTYEWEQIRVDLRWWSTYIVLPPLEEDFAIPITGWVHAASLRVCWSATPDFMLGASYTYGPELDQTPSNYELLSTKSQVISLFADLRVRRDFGLQPMLGLERRRPPDGPTITIGTAELAAYVRW